MVIRCMQQWEQVDNWFTVGCDTSSFFSKSKKDEKLENEYPSDDTVGGGGGAM